MLIIGLNRNSKLQVIGLGFIAEEERVVLGCNIYITVLERKLIHNVIDLHSNRDDALERVVFVNSLPDYHAIAALG